LYFQSLLTDLTLEKILLFMNDSKVFREALNNIESRKIDPITAAQRVVNKICVLDSND